MSTGLVATRLGTALLRRQRAAAQRPVRRQAPGVGAVRARQRSRPREDPSPRRPPAGACAADGHGPRGRPWRGQGRSLLGLGGAAVDERASRQRTRGWSSSGTAVGARWRARCAEAGGARALRSRDAFCPNKTKQQLGAGGVGERNYWAGPS